MWQANRNEDIHKCLTRFQTVIRYLLIRIWWVGRCCIAMMDYRTEQLRMKFWNLMQIKELCELSGFVWELIWSLLKWAHFICQVLTLRTFDCNTIQQGFYLTVHRFNWLFCFCFYCIEFVTLHQCMHFHSTELLWVVQNNTAHAQIQIQLGGFVCISCVLLMFFFFCCHGSFLRVLHSINSYKSDWNHDLFTT